MGKLAEQIQTGTKVAEQVTNKSLMITSTVANYFSNIDNFDEEFNEFVMKTYFPFLLEDEPKPSVESKKYPLSPEEKSLLSIFDPIEINSRTPVHNINKVRFNKFTLSTNDYSIRNNELTNNQFIKSKNGKYFMIYKIIRVRSESYLFVHEYLNPKHYAVREGLEFPHVKFTSQLSTTLQIMKLTEIDVPISVLFFNDVFFLLDLFNRHR